MSKVSDLINEKWIIKNKEHLSKEDYERLAEIETELKEISKVIDEAFKNEFEYTKHDIASAYNVGFKKGQISVLEKSINSLERLKLLGDAVTKGFEAAENEMPKGKWIIDDLDNYDCNRVWTCHCSICNRNPLNYIYGWTQWWLCKTQMPRYCPSCGAEMEVEE